MKYYNEYKQALEYRHKGLYADALAIIEKINKLDPKCELIKLELARLLIIKGTTKNKRIARKILLELCETEREYAAILELGQLELSEGNYDVAEELFKNLLDTTWEDDALFQLINLEEKRENNDKAEKYLMILLNKINDYSKITKDTLILKLAEIKINKGEYLEARKTYEYLLYNLEDKYKNKNNIYNARKKLIILNIKQENYAEAYACLQEINDIIEETQNLRLSGVRFYLEYKLGILKDPDSYKSYFSSQVLHYNENKALYHIKSHLYEKNEKFVHTTFYDDIDIEKLFNEIKIKIQGESIKKFSFCDCYMIDCGYPIGMIDKRETTKMKVITIPNTKNIISMYPILSFDKANDYSYDLDKIETYKGNLEATEVTEKHMVKKKTRLSQIDKFNKKYGNC